MISEDRHKYLTDLGCMAAGQGTIAAYYYIAGGACFACNGRGSR